MQYSVNYVAFSRLSFLTDRMGMGNPLRNGRAVSTDEASVAPS